MTHCADCGGTLDGYELCGECADKKQLWRVQLVMRRPETGHCYIGSWLVVSEDGPRAIETTLQSLDLGGVEVLRHRAQPQEADAPIQVGSLIRSRGYEEQ